MKPDDATRKFAVLITRTESVTQEITVVARNAKDAKKIAIEEADNIAFGPRPAAKYTVEKVLPTGNAAR